MKTHLNQFSRQSVEIMKIQAGRLFMLSGFIILLFLFPAQSFGQTDVHKLLDRKIDFHFEKTTLLYVLDSTRQKYDLPVLFEVADSGYVRGNPVDLNAWDMTIHETSLRGLLDSIVKQRPLYKWEITDGVINFVPIAKRDPFLEKLFNTPVKSFSLKGYTYFSEMDEKLAAIPTVAELLKSHYVELNEIYDFSGIGRFVPDEADLSISGTTFKGVLDNIVKKSRRNFIFVHLKTVEYDGKTRKILYI